MAVQDQQEQGPSEPVTRNVAAVEGETGASHSATRAAPSLSVKKVGALLLVVLPLFVPEVVLGFTPLRVDASFVIAGMLPALIGWTYAPRYALLAIPVSGVLNALAVLVFSHPVPVTILMTIIAVMVGASAYRGLHAVTAFAAIQPAISVIAGHPTVTFGDVQPGAIGQALICAGIAVMGGLWAVAMGVVLLRGQSSGPPDRVPAPIVVFYTCALMLLLGLSAYIASTWFTGTSAGWVLLTILLVLRPTYDESRLMIAERAGGTVVGVALAAAVAQIVPNSAILVLLGIIAMIVAAALQLQHARYAYFAVFVTLAIVLLDAQRSNVFETDIRRLVYTIVGVSLVAAVVAAGSTLLGRFAPASE
jgi:Fusaric acid resistance protein-like